MGSSGSEFRLEGAYIEYRDDGIHLFVSHVEVTNNIFEDHRSEGRGTPILHIHKDGRPEYPEGMISIDNDAQNEATNG